MVTESFCIDLPEIVFQHQFRHCCDMNEIQYPDPNDEVEFSKFRDHIQNLWNEFGDDIISYIEGEIVSKDTPDDIEWDNEADVAKAVLLAYVDFCVINREHPIDVETFWKEIVISAMMANGENLFDANGPLNIYGEGPYLRFTF